MPPKQNLSRMGSRRADTNNNLQMLSNFKLPSTATLGSIPPSHQYPMNNRYAVYSCSETDSQSSGSSGSDAMSIAGLDETTSPLPTRPPSPSNHQPHQHLGNNNHHHHLGGHSGGNIVVGGGGAPSSAIMRSKYNTSPLHSRGVLTMSMSPLNNLNKTPPPGIFIEQKTSAVFSPAKSKNLNNTSPTQSPTSTTSPHKDQSSPSLYFLQRQHLSPTHHHHSQYVKKGLELATEVYQIAPKRSSSKSRINNTLITRRTSMQSSTMTTK